MTRTDAASVESALYATLDCGGEKVMRARGNIADRLNAGKQPRRRDDVVFSAYEWIAEHLNKPLVKPRPKA